MQREAGKLTSVLWMAGKSTMMSLAHDVPAPPPCGTLHPHTHARFKFQIPSYYTLLVRSLTVLEGIALASDPNYKVLSAAYPWVARRLLTDATPELHSTLRRLLYSDDNRFQFSRLTSLLEQAAKVKALGQMRPAGAAAAGAAGAGAKRGSLMPAPAAGSSPLKLLLSNEGAFVRGIVLDEVAKVSVQVPRAPVYAAVLLQQQQGRGSTATRRQLARGAFCRHPP